MVAANVVIVLRDSLHDEVNSVSGNDDVGDASFLETTLVEGVLSDTLVEGVLSDSQTAKTDVVLEAMVRLEAGRKLAVESSSASALVGVPMEDTLMVGVPMEDTPIVGVPMTDTPMVDGLDEGKGNIAKIHKTKDGNGAVAVDVLDGNGAVAVDILLDGGGGNRWYYFVNRAHDQKPADKESKLKEKGAHREIVVGWVLGIQGFDSRQRLFSHPM
jgi:hypothetical protein